MSDRHVQSSNHRASFLFVSSGRRIALSRDGGVGGGAREVSLLIVLLATSSRGKMMGRGGETGRGGGKRPTEVGWCCLVGVVVVMRLQFG